MIQWYPGHMKKTKELINSHINMMDVLVEVVDARIPLSSHNPIFDNFFKNKKVITILNKSDLADPGITKEWIDYYNKNNNIAIEFNSKDGSTKELNNIFKNIFDEFKQPFLNKNRNPRPMRVMILGIPNVGKSSFINRLANKKITQVGNKPGVTRGKQWIKINDFIELFDTPGILWPKFENEDQAFKIAMIGSINDDIIPLEEVAFRLLDYLKDNYYDQLVSRFSITHSDTYEIYQEIAKKRGCIQKGNNIDDQRVTNIIIDEFRSSKIGRVSLERVKY